MKKLTVKEFDKISANAELIKPHIVDSIYNKKLTVEKKIAYCENMYGVTNLLIRLSNSKNYIVTGNLAKLYFNKY